MAHADTCQTVLSGSPPDGEAPARPDAATAACLQANVLDALATHIAVLDAQGRIVTVNRAWTEFARESGLTADASGVGVNYLATLQRMAERGDASAAQALQGLQAVLAGAQQQFELEFPCRGPRGENWYLMNVSPLPDRRGCVVSHLKITKRKTAERAHSRLAAILEATTDFVGIADEQGRELYANRAFRQLRGLGLAAHDPLATIPDNHPQWALRKILDEAMPEAARHGVWAGESAVLDACRREIPVHQVILAHRNERGDIDFFSTIMRDISASKQQAATLQQAFDELKHTQEQLVQSEKMASIGQLAAGVAHEINNPIGYLNSNLGTLGQYIEGTLRVVTAYEAALPSLADSPSKAAIEQTKRETDFEYVVEDIPKLLAESLEGIQRVRKIVQDLKDFAHAGNSEDWQWVDLRQSLSRTLNIVNNELKYKAEVVQSYEAIPEIRCLPGQLNQVFMNLLVNAAHAIETRGQVKVSAWQQGDEIQVEIADTGCGMSPEVKARIFEPFFTTKPASKGTGLGLSISYGIVCKHGGRIEVESEPGHGTTFRMVLPIAGPDAAGGGDKA